METLSPNIATHFPSYGSRLLHGQGNLWKTTWRSYEIFGREFCYLVNVHEYHSSSSGSSPKRQRREFWNFWRIIFGTAGQLFREEENAGRGSDRNHWHEHEQFPRFEVGIDKLIVQSILSTFHCQSQRFLRLCALFGKNGRQSCCVLEEANSQWYSDNNCFSELNRIDGQLMDIEWKIFPGFTTVGILNQKQQMMRELLREPEHFTGRIIIKSMFHDIVMGCQRKWWNMWKQFRDNWAVCSKIPARSLVFLGAWIWKEVVRNLRSQTRWILGQNCRENAAELRRIRSSNIPWYQCFGERERRIKKRRRRIDINSLRRKYGEYWAVNQLSIYGAVADMIEVLPVGQRAVEKPAASGQLDKVEILSQPPLAEVQANAERPGNLLQEYEQRFEKMSEDLKLSRLCSEAGLR